ncbi:MAG: hypothetical protein LBG05_08605 [Treponema sp.]|jgi:hypothetical protein|nr:hypothetical protein [Treponema sp.]
MEEYKRILSTCFAENKDVVFDHVEVYGDFLPTVCKFTGAVMTDDGRIVGIPNSGNQIVVINPDFEKTGREPFELFNGAFESEPFGWTGGVLYKGNIFALPRNANSVLKIDPSHRTAERIALPTTYEKANSAQGRDFHHYSGALCNGKIYCTPKGESHILVIDLDALNGSNAENVCHCIPCEAAGYLGAVLHPNGLIYFSPPDGCQVMILDPVSEKIRFIGDKSIYGAFKMSISPDGTMYGYSHSKGILKVDTVNERVTNVCDKIGVVPSGIYGCSWGFNGKCYAYISNNIHLFEFNPNNESVSILAVIDDGKFNYAKCAGGILAQDGSIWQVPAFGRFIYRIVFSGIKTQLPIEFLKQPYFSGY